LRSHLLIFFILKFLESLVPLYFGLGFCLRFSRLEISVKFVVFFISLALQVLFNQNLSTLKLIEYVLELFGSSGILQSILIVSQLFKFQLVKLLSKFLLEQTVLCFKFSNFGVVIFLNLKHDRLFFICDFVIVLLDLNINFNQLFVKFLSAKSSLFQITLQHVCLSLFIVD